MPLSIRLTDEDDARLTALAARTGQSKSFHVRRAIHLYLDEVEELAWADAAIKEWEAAGKPSRPIEEFLTELDL